MDVNRREAAKILDEIMRKCNMSSLTKRVSLSRIPAQTAASDDYELQIGIEPDNYLKDCINVVLEKHNLAMKKSEKTLTIYNPK